jgi:Outer membrane lipoprotein carrier protein LolA-like
MITGASALRAVLCACSLAWAQNEWRLADLMRDLRAVRAVRATFVETKYLNALSAPLELSGRLVYRAPDRLEKHTLKPVDERLLLEGDLLTIEDSKRRRSLRLERNPPVRAFVESIRSTLAGDLQTLQRFYDVDFSGDRGRWRLVLAPTDADMQSLVREIRISGHHAWVGTIEIVDAGGDRSVMTISPEAQ